MVRWERIIDWKRVNGEIRELASGEYGRLRIESVVKEVMIEIIKREYPNNYQKVMRANKEKLLKIKARLAKKFFHQINSEALKIADPE